MDVRAAVAFEAGKPLSIETVQLDGSVVDANVGLLANALEAPSARLAAASTRTIEPLPALSCF